MDKYLQDLTDNMIDAIDYQINKWLDDGVTVTREVIDNTIDQYYDEVTGNDYGATPTRIYHDDAEAYFKANADTLALLGYANDNGITDALAEAYSGGDYNKLDVLESCRVYEANRDAIVDAVCKYYEVTEGVNHGQITTAQD